MEKYKKKMVILEEKVHRTIKHVAIDEDTSIQVLVNDILRKKYNIPKDDE